MDLVSIIVPNYNGERYIDDFIKSVQNQTYTNWELLIVDDNSSDESREIIQRHANQDNRIKLLTKEGDAGACQRRNQGFDNAKGEFVIFVDSDDLLPKDTLQIRVDELRKNPDLDFVVCPAITFNNKPFDLKRLALGLPLFKDDLAMFLKRYRLPFGVWTNTYRKSFFDRTNIRWDENLASMQDSDFNIQCLSIGAKYKYADNQSPGYYWRVGTNPNSITKTIARKHNLDSQLYFYNKLLSKFKGTKYEKDLRRFGLTLLCRFAQLQYIGDPSSLFLGFGRAKIYRILKSLYSKKIFFKSAPIINLLFFPIPIGEQYLFLIHNRIICKKYIQSQEAKYKKTKEKKQ